jgi:ribosomal protein S21
MANNTYNLQVTLKEVGGNTNRLIKRFIKKVKKERIIEDYLDRSRYIKPSTRKRKARLKSLENARKANRERNDTFEGRR